MDGWGIAVARVAERRSLWARDVVFGAELRVVALDG